MGALHVFRSAIQTRAHDPRLTASWVAEGVGIRSNGASAHLVADILPESDGH
jgi:hypothetical protein